MLFLVISLAEENLIRKEHLILHHINELHFKMNNGPKSDLLNTEQGQCCVEHSFNIHVVLLPFVLQHSSW